MAKDPLFVTGISLARSQEFVVAAFYAPAGEFKPGRLEAIEAMRVVMSFSTLKVIAETLMTTCREIEAINALNANAAPKSGRSAIAAHEPTPEHSAIYVASKH
jgi:hypothetical protein